MNAAVVGLLATIGLRLAWVAIRFPETHRFDAFNLVILLIALAALLRGINATWLVLAAGIAGATRWYLT